MMKPPQSWRRWLFYAVWLLTTVVLACQLLLGRRSFGSPATVPALGGLLACTAALLLALPKPVAQVPSAVDRTRRARFVLVLLVTTVALFALRTLVGPPLLFALPVLALVVMLVLRPRVNRREGAYALILALVAGVAGLGAQWVDSPAPVWAALQVALVWLGLLAGWSLLRSTGLWEAGLGRSLFLDEGAKPAARGFALGLLIAMPWALGLVVLGAAEGESWVQRWWQPLLAIQPAIAEEAWGRVLLVPLLFVIFRRLARGRAALAAAVVILAYWFAYLHTAGGIGAMTSTLMIGTLYAIPTSYLWLRGGLEMAIGFHFWLDFVKFAAAYLLNRGLWIP